MYSFSTHFYIFLACKVSMFFYQWLHLLPLRNKFCGDLYISSFVPWFWRWLLQCQSDLILLWIGSRFFFSYNKICTILPHFDFLSHIHVKDRDYEVLSRNLYILMIVYELLNDYIEVGNYIRFSDSVTCYSLLSATAKRYRRENVVCGDFTCVVLDLMEFEKHAYSFQTGIIPWAAKRFSTQNTMCFSVIFFSSTRKGSTVLAPFPYDDREKPFGPVTKIITLDFLSS